MRTVKLHLLLSQLALVAMLLLATVPTLGRLATPRSLQAHSHAMHMAGGHAMQAADDGSGRPIPPSREHAHDCDYCVLLSGAMPSTLAVIVVPAVYPDYVSFRRGAPAVPALPALRGLGARGPPPTA